MTRHDWIEAAENYIRPDMDDFLENTVFDLRPVAESYGKGFPAYLDFYGAWDEFATPKGRSRLIADFQSVTVTTEAL